MIIPGRRLCLPGIIILLTSAKRSILPVHPETPPPPHAATV
nr:MAG TPA: hypothetical protein [Caudoviricetes sp.]DAN32489.1 MAG TPA: hypothetical protein [Caudoviricetes sp.]